MEIEVRVVALVPDIEHGSVLIMLREVSGERMLPVFIGILEGNSIFLGIEGIPTVRPLTHDLFKNVLAEYAIELEKVVITDFIDPVFHALLYTKNADRTVTIDARPSDAIALALRFKCPIYVESDVFKKAKSMPHSQESRDEIYGRVLDSLDPEKMSKT